MSTKLELKKFHILGITDSHNFINMIIVDNDSLNFINLIIVDNDSLNSDILTVYVCE